MRRSLRFLITLIKRNRKILNKKNCAARRRNNRKRRLVGKTLEIEAISDFESGG